MTIFEAVEDPKPETSLTFEDEGNEVVIDLDEDEKEEVDIDLLLKEQKEIDEIMSVDLNEFRYRKRQVKHGVIT